jgi:hypothetical protein
LRSDGAQQVRYTQWGVASGERMVLPYGVGKGEGKLYILCKIVYFLLSADCKVIEEKLVTI